MSVYNVFFFMLVFVQIMAQISIPYSKVKLLPECYDEFMEPTTPADLAKKYRAEGDKAFSWFCPYGFASQEIDVFSCASGDYDTCLRTTETVGGGISAMNECRDWMSYFNWRKRVLTCMPWEINPRIQRYIVAPPEAADIGYDDFTDRDKTGMRHLRTQFLTFKPLWQWYETPPKTQDTGVPRCDSSADDIYFTNKACWHSDAEVVFLKPRYKFKFIQSDNKKLCVLSNTVLGTDILSFNSDSLTYTPQSTAIKKKFTHCKWWGKDIRYWTEELVRPLISDVWNKKEIQYHDYKLETKSTPCMDSVTEPCVDNVFSFFAKECVWVHKTDKDKPISLSSMLWPLATEDKESFETYGDQMYVMNLDGRNINVWVGTVQAVNQIRWSLWNGGATKLDPRQYWLKVTEKTGYSCSGCTAAGQALDPTANADKCGVPLKCKLCDPWQRVDTPWRNSWSKCESSFAIRKCAACEKHHVRSTSTEQRADELCVPCPPLTPMRREGQVECTVCEHTQWFDPASTSGCFYFMSVADGISFVGAVRFDKTYVDQYKPVGSSRPPQEVPALHYRNLVADGNKWNASTIAEMCAPGSFGVVNASVSGVFTRNVHGRRMQFRRWCGHREILKEDNVLMQPLDCGNRRPGNATSLSELVTGSAGMYALVKERRFILNRMAEVKLTMLSDGFSCYYELRREGRAEDCRYCPGTMYTQGCGPTYYPELAVPAVAGPGTCASCEEQCSSVQFPNHFFAVTQFSCWSNGTERVQGSAGHGSLKLIKSAMSANMNYWYKPAACVPCAGLSDAAVPQIVTRCGNKASFETWDPTLKSLDVAQVSRPQSRFCCALDRNSNVGTICRPTESDLGLTTATPLCETVVPDLQTEYVNFCPPNWFLDRTGDCAGALTVWKRSCCKECELCQGAGKFKTDTYMQCSGGTDYDTQLKGCVASCTEKNYEVNGTCVACESCA